MPSYLDSSNPSTIQISSKQRKAIDDKEKARIIIRSNVGDLIGALNNGAMIQVEGNAGRYAADGMISGEVIIDGDSDEGAGTRMLGGTLVIKGNAGHNIGQFMKGGTIIVGGNVGNHVGSFMIDGRIIIGGDTGSQLGSHMIGGTIYVKGNHRKLGFNTHGTDLTLDEKKSLERLLAKYKLNPESNSFKKMITESGIL